MTDDATDRPRPSAEGLSDDAVALLSAMRDDGILHAGEFCRLSFRPHVFVHRARLSMTYPRGTKAMGELLRGGLVERERYGGGRRPSYRYTISDAGVAATVAGPRETEILEARNLGARQQHQVRDVLRRRDEGAGAPVPSP